MYVSLFDKVHLIQSLETHFTWLYSLSIYVVWYLPHQVRYFRGINPSVPLWCKFQPLFRLKKF